MTFLKKNDSFHARLADILAIKKGIPRENTHKFLRVISAPPELNALIKVSKNCLGIFPLLNGIDQENWSKKDISDLAEVASTCIALKENITEEIPEFGHVKRGKLGGLKGLLGKHPVYGAIRQPPPPESNSAIYFHLLAHLLNAFEICNEFQKENNEIKFENNIKTSSRKIRQLATKKEHRAFLSHFPENIYSVEDFNNYLKDAPGKWNTSEAEIIDSIEKLLECALGERSDKNKGKHKKHSKKYEAIHIVEEKHDIYEINPAPDRKLFYNQVISDDKKDAARRAGCSDDESFSGPQMIVDKTPVQTEMGVSTTIQAYRTRNRNRSIATANQLLPQRWDRLNLHDVTHLLLEARDLIHKNTDETTPSDENLSLKLSALIAIMYWTSSPLERALRSRISINIEKLPKTIQSGELFYCLSEKVWAIGQTHLDQRRRVEGVWPAYMRSSNDYILIPCSSRVAQLLNPWTYITAKRINTKSQPFFKDSGGDLAFYLKRFISYVNKKCQTRLTPHRISNHLFSLLADKAGDEADAAIITGRPPSTGQVTQLYYYAPTPKRLREIYTQTCHDVINSVQKAIGRPLPRKPYINKKLKLGNTPVGSQICPTQKTVNQLVTDLTADYKLHLGSRERAGNQINIHNAFTTYCIMMIGFATGYRAVKEPFYDERDIDWKTGFAVISDKDDNDYYNSRLVWLPPICLEQLKLYKKHRSQLADEISIFNPKTSKALISPINKSPWGTPPKNSKNQKQLPGFLFYLKPNGAHQSITPYQITNRIESFYELPLNANRHYLRTRLREAGVGGETVDAFMGHWLTGQEPHGKYSSFSPECFQQELAEPLSTLLQKDGWKPIKGL